MDRRQALVALGSALNLSIAGCIGFITGEEALAFEATRATVPDAALDGTGYTEDEVGSEAVTRSFTVAGQSREVEVTNWLARYERSIELGPLGEQELGVFAVLSTPQVRVLDRTFNPVGEMSNRELLEQLQARYSGLSVGDRVGSDRLRILGEDATVDRFEATATFEAAEVELRVHVTTVAHADDYVVPIAIYPRRLPGEADRVNRLYEAIEH